MEPVDYAKDFVTDVILHDQARDRSQQTQDRRLGVSDVGHCREYARRLVVGEPFTDQPDSSQARAGTYFHAGVLAARQQRKPYLRTEVEVHVPLPNGVTLLGHADEVDVTEPSVTDLKTLDGGIPLVRRNGPTQQQVFQRNLYYAGAHAEGLVPAQGIVRNIWVERSGKNVVPHVDQADYHPGVVGEAARWVDEVMVHVERGTEAPRDKDFWFCQQFCPFFTACRVGEVEPVVTNDPELAAAAAAYDLGHRLEKRGKAMKEAAGGRLRGVSSFVTDGGARWKVKTTDVEGGVTAETYRKPSQRLTVQKVA